ncbi:hypothetical protein PVL29_026317 [Vitis rotundifolia]|uniref:DNA-directed RNA polymerase n=1 Tax=Vitis rotundifolia TaxID=103349 RepID=A0AA38YM46_VITRO|nr:hypothetical protein PVL29_026317 [Vitis rotundifolia]
MKRIISRLIDHFGMAYTSHILDQVKTLGFKQATATSISLGIDDLLTILSKGWLVQDAEQQSLILEKHHHYGNVHTVEKLLQSIEIWYATIGMREIMSNPQGQVIDLPIQSNLHEGLSLTKYIISSYRAHKGVVDIVVRTSDAGYLTRGLVEVFNTLLYSSKWDDTIKNFYSNINWSCISRQYIYGPTMNHHSKSRY